MQRIAASAKRVVGTASFEAPPPAVRVLQRLYHERVVDHYNNPRNVGSFDKNDPTVGTGLVGAPACGDVMKLQIKVDENTGKIVDARFKTFGCGSAIASSSVGMFVRGNIGIGWVGRVKTRVYAFCCV
ncbi:iron-sulfur cluster assembly protein 1-like [Gastrolobium bilobum]|uniref:iron-sulfur cluster assembly protein 1-like n=1 Tax=Gastrolobium bilobum TaxID=150636 RepID=UPI002AAFEE96|nr:iron-sulfur cluster assembly protein 1-like [Gastrolobium bilobum]